MKRVKNIDTMLNKVGGKFFTLEQRTAKDTSRFCAKLIRNSNSFVTVYDVNTGLERKMNKNTLALVQSGQFAYRA